ncbi:MAG: hypothetical protein NPIRA02_13280 [Nitrospirales bacterium]|nr:MAG: hypothetical protein NPIRA02_13280 [Nitrospirales bacterium]
MKKRSIVFNILGMVMGVLFVQAAHASLSLVSATDVNPDPNIFEAYLTADEQDVMIDGTTVHALVYRDDPPGGGGAPAGIPAPMIVVTVGDKLIIHLRNELDGIFQENFLVNEKTSIHWHGIELDNNSDGTAVTQDQLRHGDTYVYRFTVTRPGIFWYHPHMKPTGQEFAGMYGALIVKDSREDDLEERGRIPKNVRTIILSDIEFVDRTDVQRDPRLESHIGVVGFQDGGGIGNFKTVDAIVEFCAEELSRGALIDPNTGCRILSGDTVLVNGGVVRASTHTIVAKSGEGIRLRLINPSITRYFRLKLVGNTDTNGNPDSNLYRIGGEGGLLESVRLEGGVLGRWNTGYEKGEVVLAPADRADVVLVPRGKNGDIIKIVSSFFDHRPKPGGGGATVTEPFDVLFVEIQGVETPAYSVAEGDKVLGSGAIENLKARVITHHFQPVPAGQPGSMDETIRFTTQDIFTNIPTEGKVIGPRIDTILGRFEDSGINFTAVAHAASTRYAVAGEVLELTIKNETQAHHPFHLHGASFQPVKILNNAGATLFTFTHNEFVDNFDIHDGQQLVFRVRFDDRAVICDDVIFPYACSNSTSRGAAGRWLFHCHIFHHAALGMISEVVVLTPDLNGDGCVDQRDVSVVFADRNNGVGDSNCGVACDLDGDGQITVLDARRLVTLFTNPSGTPCR